MVVLEIATRQLNNWPTHLKCWQPQEAMQQNNF